MKSFDGDFLVAKFQSKVQCEVAFARRRKARRHFCEISQKKMNPTAKLVLRGAICSAFSASAMFGSSILGINVGNAGRSDLLQDRWLRDKGLLVPVVLLSCGVKWLAYAISAPITLPLVIYDYNQRPDRFDRHFVPGNSIKRALDLIRSTKPVEK